MLSARYADLCGKAALSLVGRKPPRHLAQRRKDSTVRNVATAFQPDQIPAPAITREPASTTSSMVPLLAAVVLVYSLLLPPQFYVNVGGSVITPFRILLLASSIYIAAQLLSGRLRLVWPDILVIAAAAWIVLSLYITTGGTDALTASIAQVCDIGFSYLFARCAFRSLRDVRIFLILLAPGIAVMGGLIAIESVTKTNIVQPFFSSITGSPVTGRSTERMGLMRARGGFPHAILAGMFFSSFLSLYALSGIRRMPWLLGIFASLMSFFTVSSAAVLALVFGIGLIAYNWLSERFAQLSWKLFFFASTVIIFVLESASNSGSFNLIIRYASLNSGSAYNRVLIWRYGTQNVEQAPWFGRGYADWERPDWMVASIDNYWLLLAIQYGVMAPALIVLATVLCVFAVMRRSTLSSLIDARFQRGIAIAVSVFALGAISVALWLEVQVWYFVLLGMAVSIAHAPVYRRTYVRATVDAPQVLELGTPETDPDTAQSDVPKEQGKP